MTENPFTVSFGRANTQIIERDSDLQTIFDDFDKEPAQKTTYILTGPRGCGKTVALSHILDHYRAQKNWVVARLSMTDNMIEQLASLLYENGLSKYKFLKAEFSVSFHGISFHVAGNTPATSIETYLEKILAYYKSKGIRILVAIDDVAKTPAMVNFIRTYQRFLIDHHDVRLLLTGLYKNISKLETERSLTFLFRAPKIQLSSLSLLAIAQSYESVFHMNEDEALETAKLTKGYALAYQILGDILFRKGKKEITSAVLKEFDKDLAEWSYDIIWSELTIKEKEILTAVAQGFSSNQEIMEKLSMSKGNLAIYKKQLSQEGLLNVSIRGKLQFSLPRFDRYVILQKKLEED